MICPIRALPAPPVVTDLGDRGCVLAWRRRRRRGCARAFLDAETAQLLRGHHQAQLLAYLENEPAQNHDLIFCKPDGRPWHPDHVTRAASSD
jgi:hypothetical protein